MFMLNEKTGMHPTDLELADFLSGKLSSAKRKLAEKHLSSCDKCISTIVAAHDAVAKPDKGTAIKRMMDNIVKKINIYLFLTVVSFILSFITPRFFIQLLVATLLLGLKWVADSKSTKMLIMIHEAWRRDGARGASNAIETLDESKKLF